MSFSRSNHHNTNYNSRFKHNRTKRFDHYVDVSGEAPAKSNVEVAFLNFLRDAGHHGLKMANKVMFNEDSLRFSVRLFGRRNDLHHFRKEFQSHLAPVFFGKRLSVSKVSETRHSRHEPSRMGMHRRPQPVWYYATTDENDSFLPLDPEVSIRLEEGRRSQEVEILLNGTIHFIVKLHEKFGLMMKTKTSNMDDGRVVVRCQGLVERHHPITTTQVIQNFLNLSLTHPLNRPEFWQEESSSSLERFPILKKCGSKLNVINSSTNSGFFIARNIARLFEKSMSPTEYEILSIDLVEHPILFQSYQNFRVARSLQSQDFDLNEKLLFFGGSKTDVDRCLRRGFLREYEEQTLMGRGVYFSKDANAAAIRSSPDATHMHVRRVICAMVVCGESMTSSPTMIRPPLKHDSEVEYETLVDNLIDPNTFVIPNDNQAYPLAEIQFTRKFDETASTSASVASTHILTPPFHGIRRATPESSASPQALYHHQSAMSGGMGPHSMNNFAVSMARSSGVSVSVPQPQQIHPMTTPFIGVPPAAVWVQQSMPQSLSAATGCPQQMGQTQFMHMPVGRNGMHFEGTVANAPKNFVMTHSRVA